MLKQVSVMKRRPGMTMDEFIRDYEARHAAFGEQLFSKARRYLRRYVQPEKHPLTGEVVELEFDVIMEIWWESREDFEAAMKSLTSSELLPAVSESGKKLFASQNNPAFTVIEYESQMGAA
jgi:hypothetical protein